MNFKKIIFLFISFISLILFISCKSSQQVIEQKPLEYNDKKIRQTEITEIERILPTDPIRAMEKAVHLLDAANFDEDVQNIFSKCEDKLIELFKSSLKNFDGDDVKIEVDYFESSKYYQSLKTCGSKKLKELNVTDELLFEKAYNKLIGSNVLMQNANNRESSQKKSDFINGTVTIWVDLGVKVENGLGVADRVIGSGFFIDKRGYLITNCHVIEKHVDPKYQGFSKVYIKMADDPDTRIPCKVIGWDSSLDLALLKAEVNPPYVFNLGSSDNIEIGQKIYAIGSPVGLEKTITSGIVSAFDRKIFSVASVMQIDAAINSGNSGGPLIDEYGNVQAIVFAGILDFQGLNFAIPIEYLKLVLPYLYNGSKVEHSWCGALGRTKKINPTDVDGIGVEVFYTMTTGSAFYSGLQKGDIITSVAGTKITSIETMQTALLYYLPNTIVPFEVTTKDGKHITRKVRLLKRDKNPGIQIFEKEILQKSMYPLFGMELEKISEYRDKYIITSIIPGSIADESGFSANDPIEILTAKLLVDKEALYSEIYAKKRKNGYLDIAVAMFAPLDSPFIF